jgi:hypothetical protein
MKINNNIKPFPKYLSEEFNKIIEMPKPLRSDGIFFKRDRERTAGEMLEEARFQRGLDNYELYEREN